MAELPYVYTPQMGPKTPLVVSVPHAGTDMSPRDEALYASDERTMLRDADLMVDRIYKGVPELGAALIVASVSRYVLDLNRGPHDTERTRGLFWRLATDGQSLFKRPLTTAEIADRIARVHTPYHTKLNSLLQERKEEFGYAILLDGHSMPSVGRVEHADTGTVRADIVPGNNRGQSCAPVLTDLVMSHFRNDGFSVALNTPYAGGWITQNYGRPADGVHAIQIELNRALYLNEAESTYAAESAERVIVSAESLVRKLVTLDLSGH